MAWTSAHLTLKTSRIHRIEEIYLEAQPGGRISLGYKIHESLIGISLRHDVISM